MAWQDKLALLFGSNPETAGMLGEQGNRQAAMQGLMGLGASLLESGGPSTVPISGGQALGRALQAGQQGYQGAVQQGLQAQDYAAQRQAMQDEIAARKELQALLASGNVTDEALLRIATQFPQAQNVIQQYMKGRQTAQVGPPAEPITRDIGNGNQVVYDGKRWQLIRGQKPAPDRVDPNQSKIDALRSLGIPDDQIATALGVKLPKAADAAAGGGEVAGGFNDRQRGGAQQVANSAIQYAAALTGASPTELATMSPEEVEALVVERGGRLFQGPVMGELPYLSNRVNADLNPYAESMAASQALVNNPSGPVTKPDVDTAAKTVPNPGQKIEIQAKLIADALRQGQRASGQKSSSKGRTIVRRGTHQRRPVIEYSNGDIEYAD